MPSGPEQNFIEVRRDWSDLEEKFKYYLSHPEEEKQIVENSVESFRKRYLTPAAEACYWREMMRRYAEVSFQPEPFEEKDIDFAGKKERVKRLRGVAHELFIGTGIDEVEPKE